MFKSEYDEVKANLIKKSLEKDKTDVYVPVERRKGNDVRLKIINLMCFLVWGVLIIILAIIERAGKSIMNITRNDLLWQPLSFWDINLLNIALCFTIGCMIICTICIILNFTRHKRRSDKIKKSLVIVECLCFIIAIFLIVKMV